MGSRAVVVVCRDADVARARFGVDTGETGCIYTRTGRRFFENEAVETALLARVAAAIGKAGFWDGLSTNWMVLDCELMPWSAKAQELLRKQYAPVGASAVAATAATAKLLRIPKAWRNSSSGRKSVRRLPRSSSHRIAGIAGQCRASMISSWRRSMSLRQKAACTLTRITTGTCKRSLTCAPRTLPFFLRLLTRSSRSKMKQAFKRGSNGGKS